VSNEFFTIRDPTEGFYKEKGSKFLSFAFPIKGEEEIHHHLQTLRTQYYDARHHCYAYIIGLKVQAYRANDDGEPNHSAGDPILGQIRSKNLTNCLVVVVRYFGGTKLGVGGLISAYKIAAEDALAKAEILTIHSLSRLSLSFDYNVTSAVEQILGGFQLIYIDKEFTDSCKFLMDVLDEDVSILKEKFVLIPSVKIEQLID
jgi:uncharacterized YigZ family protein